MHAHAPFTSSAAWRMFVDNAASSGYNSRAVEDIRELSTLICGRCATACDAGDRFCRQCGMSLTDDQLPLKREQRVPDVWRPRVSGALLRAATVVAVGAFTEIMARRLAREAGRRVANVTRLPGSKNAAPAAPVVSFQEEHMVSETVYLRRSRAVGRRG